MREKIKIPSSPPPTLEHFVGGGIFIHRCQVDFMSLGPVLRGAPWL